MSILWYNKAYNPTFSHLGFEVYGHEIDQRLHDVLNLYLMVGLLNIRPL